MLSLAAAAPRSDGVAILGQRALEGIVKMSCDCMSKEAKAKRPKATKAAAKTSTTASMPSESVSWAFRKRLSMWWWL